jgi:hypothetical protein
MPIVPWQCASGDVAPTVLPCAATVALAPPDDSVDTNKIVITGSGTITSFGPPPGPQIIDDINPPVQIGVTKQVTFEPASPTSPIVLTHSVPSLVLLGGASKTIANKSKGVYCCDVNGNWTEESFFDTTVPGVVPLPPAAVPIPAGTAMLFVQPAAPTGWTRSASHDDSLLRIVSSAAPGFGGTNGFVAGFNSQTATGNTTLTVATMPSHSHAQDSRTFVAGTGPGPGQRLYGGTGGQVGYNMSTNTSPQGGGGAHAHGITTAIKYVDALVATKD